MSVLPSDIELYGSASMPEADALTTGGAVDFTKKITFADLTANGSVNVVSSSVSDTATKCAYYGRDATGVIVNETLNLNGTTPVVGTKTLERLLYAATSGASAGGPVSNPGGTTAVGDVSLYSNTAIISAHTAQTGSANATGTTPALFKLQAGDGATVALGQIIRIKSGTGVNQLRRIIATAGYGTDIVAVNRNWTAVPDNTSTYDVNTGMLFEILPNPVTAVIRAFSTSAADIPGGSTKVYYEKGFAVNNNTATSLTGATIQISSNSPALPGSTTLDIALCKALNDTATTANRQTLPTNGDASALTFVAQPSAVSVIAGSGQLPSGAAPNTAGAQGVWFRATLPAGTAAYKGAANVQTNGSTV